MDHFGIVRAILPPTPRELGSEENGDVYQWSTLFKPNKADSPRRLQKGNVVTAQKKKIGPATVHLGRVGRVSIVSGKSLL